MKGAPRGGGLAAAASLATGLPPETHGVYRSHEAYAGGVRPVTRASWNSAPVWARLQAAAVSTGGVAWPAARPGAEWDGVHVDEDIAEATGASSATWALPLRCAPAQVREALRDLRVHPSDITAAMLAPLAPEIAEIDQGRDSGLPRLAVALARAATIQAMAVWMLDEPDPDAVFIHQPWLGQVRALADGVRDGPFRAVVDGAWRFLDGLIGRLASLAGPDALILIVSAGWRGKPGVILGLGPGVVCDADFVGADLLDVAPTVLARFGLEVADLPGQPIAGLAPRGPRASPPDAPSPPRIEADPRLIRIVEAEGYAPPSPPSASWRAQGLAELAFIVSPRAPELARDLAAAALLRHPDNLLAWVAAAWSNVALEAAEPLAGIADALDRLAPERGWGALARGAHHVLRKEVREASPWLMLAEADLEPDTLLQVAAAWIAAGRPIDAQRVFKAILSRDPENASAEVGLAMTLQGRRDFIGAEAALTRALKLDPGRWAVYVQLTRIYRRTARPAQAAQAAATAIRLGAPSDQLR